MTIYFAYLKPIYSIIVVMIIRLYNNIILCCCYYFTINEVLNFLGLKIINATIDVK